MQAVGRQPGSGVSSGNARPLSQRLSFHGWEDQNAYEASVIDASSYNGGVNIGQSDKEDVDEFNSRRAQRASARRSRRSPPTRGSTRQLDIYTPASLTPPRRRQLHRHRSASSNTLRSPVPDELSPQEEGPQPGAETKPILIEDSPSPSLQAKSLPTAGPPVFTAVELDKIFRDERYDDIRPNSNRDQAIDEALFARILDRTVGRQMPRLICR
jgi:hypothetical protein